MKVAVLGSHGMLGGMVTSVLAQTGWDIVPVDREQIDAQTATASDWAKILSGCDYAVNCIGIIKPYIHDDNAAEVRRAVEVNALFPFLLDEAATRTDTRIIQIATDCVFDGVRGHYQETDAHNATDVYGKTKSLGEVNSPHFMNLRCSIIGPETRNKFSFLEWFLTQPRNATVNGYTNHRWNGVTTLVFARLCRGIIEEGLFQGGLQHICPADKMTKADMLTVFADTFHRPDIHIIPVKATTCIDRTLGTIYPERNERLWQSAGYTDLPTIAEMIDELRGRG